MDLQTFHYMLSILLTLLRNKSKICVLVLSLVLTFWLLQLGMLSLFPEDLIGPYQKVEKMDEFLWPVKQDNYLGQLSISLNCNKASPKRGLSLDDLVALSGGHTLGFSHCSSFHNRIHNFDKKNDVDLALNASFAANLKKVRPVKNTVKNAVVTLDTTTFLFDNAYYKLVLQKKGLFSSDSTLLTNSRTKTLVSNFATFQNEFFKAFADSMIKMSSLKGSDKKIRRDCRFVN